MNHREFTPWNTDPFFDVDGIPVIEELKRHWRELADEYERYAKNPTRYQGLYPVPIYSGTWLLGALRANEVEYTYFSSPMKRRAVRHLFPNGFRGVANDVIDTAYRELMEEQKTRNRALCPLLVEILEPLYPDFCTSYMYSTMHPGVRLSPHCGRDSGNVRIHVCIKEGDDCWLEVLDERRTWQNGQALAFDDTFLHSAEHHGARDRTVIIVDFTKDYMESELRKLAPKRARM